MAKTMPNYTYTINGVTVNEKIIPDGTRWKNENNAKAAGFCAGALYKKEKLLSQTGIPKSVTIHNTNDLFGVDDDGEQYTRATYNENMSSARVHFYVDDCCAWQNLRAGTGLCPNDPSGSAEVSWHAGDGSVPDGGNMTSLSIEIIMNGLDERDTMAKENGARVAAWLLWKHNLSIDNLLTHTYWVNKLVGNVFLDVDEQCTNPVQGKKWCPAYIMGSERRESALRNWMAFKSLVGRYLDSLCGTCKNDAYGLQVGDLVSVDPFATYYDGTRIPDWVKNQKWYVSKINGDRVVIDKNEDLSNSICSPVNVSFLHVACNQESKVMTDVPYLVKVAVSSLNIRRGAGVNNECLGAITDRGVYTIVEEKTGPGATRWGKLKSGAGWISLDFTTRV